MGMSTLLFLTQKGEPLTPSQLMQALRLAAEGFVLQCRCTPRAVAAQMERVTFCSLSHKFNPLASFRFTGNQAAASASEKEPEVRLKGQDGTPPS